MPVSFIHQRSLSQVDFWKSVAKSSLHIILSEFGGIKCPIHSSAAKGGLQRKNVPHVCTLSTMVFFAHFDNLIVLEMALLPNLLQNHWDGGYAAMSI